VERTGTEKRGWAIPKESSMSDGLSVGCYLIMLFGGQEDNLRFEASEYLLYECHGLG
jgi:hypothetical protein